MSTWTTPADATARLRKKWDSGELMAAVGRDEPWEPLSIALRGPSVRDITSDLESVRAWARSWSRVDGKHIRVERRAVGGRKVGSNELPARVWFDTRQAVWAALGVENDAAEYADLVRATRERAPRLVDWMTSYPTKVLKLRTQWLSLVATVLWIEAHPASDLYVRQIDVPGVDTKFIEQHRPVLCDLLDLQLPDDRIDRDAPRSNLAGRYGFREQPRYVRVRSLDPNLLLPGRFSEILVRAEELAATPLPCGDVFVMENVVSYLAFPPVRDAIAILGSGYGVPILHTVAWLDDRRLIYWGDIDTHGFAILDRLRARFPHVRSILMDAGTLLAHESHWGHEPQPVADHLPRLTSAEAQLYGDLVEDAYGPSVRLEQERVSYSAVKRAVETVRPSGPLG